jgi:CxxC-x17-CxxC domain-containing protein
MSFQDKSIVCADCGKNFTFSAADQEFFKSKGYTNEPKRCPDCRSSRRNDRNKSTGGGGGSYGAPRQMFATTCSECGKATEVPFQPRGDKPVYCSDCYRKVRPAR